MLEWEADVVRDMGVELKRIMEQEWGYDLAHSADNDAASLYDLDTLRPQLSAIPRELHISREFVCPEQHREGWALLQRKVAAGDDLTPHLSKQYRSIFKQNGKGYSDRLLDEWGVHHFHLGVFPDKRDPSFVERDDYVVFAVVNSVGFYAINVYLHGDWAKKSIVEIMHRNWPELIEGFKIRGIAAAEIDERARKELGIKHIGSLVQVSDGTVYGALGPPVSFAGTSIESVINTDKWRAELRDLQNQLERLLPDLAPTAEPYGYHNSTSIKANLRLTDTGYSAYLPDFDLTLSIDINHVAADE